MYQYDNARSRTSGSQSAGAKFALSAGNTNPQGIADPPAAGDLIPLRQSSNRNPDAADRFDRIDLSGVADAGWDFDFLSRRERMRQRR